MIAVALVILPLVFAILVLFLPAASGRKLALAVSILVLLLSGTAYVQHLQADLSLLAFDVPWAEAFGIRFNIGIDGISMVLVLLTALLFPAIIAATVNAEIKNARSFFALMLLMQSGLLGVFMAKDAFLFYVFYELTLIPVYFICAIWGGQKSIPVTLKFFIYTLAGSLLMLVAIIYLYFKTPGNHTFDIEAFYRVALTPHEQGWIFWAFFLAFAVKIPVFPFHTWQPDTYTVAPLAGTMLLAGIMLKMGLYGLIRFVLPVVPVGLANWGNVAMVLSITGIVYASLIAWRQQDLKRLLAYSSIAHVGLITAGIFTVSIAGLQGALLQMLNHGINVVALFLMIDIIERRYGTRWMDDLGGIAVQMKRFSVLFMIALLGSVGLPLTNGFVGEFLLLMGLYEYSSWAAACAGLTLILGAVYMFRLYRNVFFGNTIALGMSGGDIRGRELILLVPLCMLVIVIGIFPSFLLDISASDVERLIQLINANKNGVSGL